MGRGLAVPLLPGGSVRLTYSADEAVTNVGNIIIAFFIT